jgi:ribosomal protein L37E
MTAQRRHEYHADRALDRDLAETIAAACCENCGRELVENEETNCAKCEGKLNARLRKFENVIDR